MYFPDFAHAIQPRHEQKSSNHREPCSPSPDNSRGKRLVDGRLKKESQRIPEMLKNNSQANQKCSEQKCSIVTLCRHPQYRATSSADQNTVTQSSVNV